MSSFNKVLKGVAAVVPFMFTSCSEENLPSDAQQGIKVLFSVEEFADAEGTRTGIGQPGSRTNVNPDKNYLITWASGDVIGIFPREGYQEPFKIPEDQVGQIKAKFDGGYWAIKQGMTYGAYYPFDKGNFASPEMCSRIPVSYRNQVQYGSTCSIGSHDYLYSDWMTAVDGSVTFRFHHIGSFAIFQLPIPVTGNYTSLTLSVGDNSIPVNGTYDMTSYSPTLQGTEWASSLTSKLDNFSGTYDQNATVYMMVPPMSLYGKVTLTLRSAKGGNCVYNLEGESFNITAGRKYEFTAKPVSSTVPGTPDEWLRKHGIIEGDDTGGGDAEGEGNDFPWHQ